jgi:hypothetical protein
VNLALQRLETRHRVELLRERVDAMVVEPEAIERPFVELRPPRLDVSRIGSENVPSSFSDEGRRLPKRVGDALVGQRRERPACGLRLPPDELEQRQLVPCLEEHYAAAVAVAEPPKAAR